MIYEQTNRFQADSQFAGRGNLVGVSNVPDKFISVPDSFASNGEVGSGLKQTPSYS